MTKAEILDKAKDIVTGDRQNAYGEVEDNFERIANLWNAYLGIDKCGDCELLIKNITKDELPTFKKSIEALTPQDVACMMILLKVARIKSGHHKDDNWIDIAGYAACGGGMYVG